MGIATQPARAPTTAAGEGFLTGLTQEFMMTSIRSPKGVDSAAAQVGAAPQRSPLRISFRRIRFTRNALLSSALMLAVLAGAQSGCSDDGTEAGPAGSTSVTGVGGGGGEAGAGGAGGAGGSAPTAVLLRPSKSSTVSVSDDDALVAMANPDDDSVAIFTTANNTRTAKLDTGDEPSAVVFGPDNSTLYVANRADATVVKITGADGNSPAVGAPVAVGSEPTGLALSPTGAMLFVAEWAEGRISVIDTASMTVVNTIEAPDHPRAIAVTNNGDEDDSDERLIVPEFFGEVVPGGEAQDDGRTGRVRSFSLDDFSEGASITLSPRDSGFGNPSVMTSPNQLYAVAIAGNQIMVPSVSASPEAPTNFNTNVQPVLYRADLSENLELGGNTGTVNLAQLVRDTIPAGNTRHFLADTVDVAMVGDSIAYVLSRGANVVQRVEYNSATGTSIGSSLNDQIDVGPAPQGAPAGCLAPTGIVTNHAGNRAFLNCWNSRRLGVVDLTLQQLTTTVEASNPPQGAAEVANNKGARFFFTGRARWSNGSWSACSSCHPDGLTDNITWSFAAGPRQTISLDGSFSHGAGAQAQRIFNWTAIFDEVHDFERNTRGVSGGLGAVTQSVDCGNLAAETPSALPGPALGLLGTPVKEIQDTQANNCTKDWDDIDSWMRTIRPPRALQASDAAAVTNGAALFQEGGCAKCHGGSGWTVSRRFFEPSTTVNTNLLTTVFPAQAFPPGFPASWNQHTTEIGIEPGTNIAPAQVSCALRNAGTFGIPGDVPGGTALEVKDNGTTAQGAGGFNIPSLYGLALGAPYLHHGQARTLNALLTDPKWSVHLQAGNPVFVPTAQEAADLEAFLLSIDADSAEQAPPAGFDVCRPTFP